MVKSIRLTRWTFKCPIPYFFYLNIDLNGTFKQKGDNLS